MYCLCECEFGKFGNFGKFDKFAKFDKFDKFDKLDKVDKFDKFVKVWYLHNREFGKFDASAVLCYKVSLDCCLYLYNICFCSKNNPSFIHLQNSPNFCSHFLPCIKLAKLTKRLKNEK